MTNLEKKQVDLIKESICVYTKCMDCRALFRNKTLNFAKIDDFVDDKGNSCLFKLKEMCHVLYRNSVEAHYKEKLYDITVGYIFHEAMKLRESLYQLEFYRPNSYKVTEKLVDSELKIVREIEHLMKKTEKRLTEGFKEMRLLMKELVGQLSGLIMLYKDNYLIPRFVLKNEKMLISIYGKKGFRSLINELYHDGKPLLLYKAAESYLESEYYDIARRLFKKISIIDRQDKSAEFFYMYASAFYFYFRNRFTRTLAFGDKAVNMDMNVEYEGYKFKLRALMDEVTKEVKNKRL
jgi:tetratricopeptide (TPR) repeat protein